MFYFTSRFPRLLMHVYDAMSICKEEAIFKQYYHIPESHHSAREADACGEVQPSAGEADASGEVINQLSHNNETQSDDVPSQEGENKDSAASANTVNDGTQSTPRSDDKRLSSDAVNVLGNDAAL
jgi:hypothetical protein